MRKPGLVRLLQAPFVLLSTLLYTVGLVVRLGGRLFGWIAWPFLKLGMAAGAVGSIYLALAGEDEIKHRARVFGDAVGRMRERCPGGSRLGEWSGWAQRRSKERAWDEPYSSDVPPPAGAEPAVNGAEAWPPEV